MIASEILADAYFREGYQVQAFPSFGVERRGAPVTAFLRIDREFIYLRSMIYQADIGIILSPDIIHAPTFKPSLKPTAALLVNSKEEIPELAEYETSYVDAVGIALECGLGSEAQPLVNTAILGAFARMTGDLKIENLLRSVEESVPIKPEQNLQAVKKAYETVI